MNRQTESRWLLLIHQIPPKPGSLRVRVWRRLQKLGSVAIKSSVYVLPRSAQAREDFEWILREIVEEGGEASICEASLVEGLDDQPIEGRSRPREKRTTPRSWTKSGHRARAPRSWR